MSGDEWNIGDKVECDRIPTSPAGGYKQSWLEIHSFSDDEDNPVVELLFKELEGARLVRTSFRHAHLSELREAGSRARMSPVERKSRKLEPIPCQCHCGESTSGASFKQGHDARLKGALQRRANGVSPRDTLTDIWVQETYDQEGAKAELERRKWPPGKASSD